MAIHWPQPIAGALLQPQHQPHLCDQRQQHCLSDRWDQQQRGGCGERGKRSLVRREVINL